MSNLVVLDQRALGISNNQRRRTMVLLADVHDHVPTRGVVRGLL